MVKKINFINLLYVIGIFLVVIGHATLNYYDSSWGSPNLVDSSFMIFVNRWIYSFHMPLFFAISGYVYGFNRLLGKYKDFQSFFMNKFNRLIVPYLLVGTLYVIPSRIIFEGQRISDYIKHLFIDIILGINPAQLWYLLALFNIFILFFFYRKLIDKFSNSWLIQFALIFIIIVISYIPSIFSSPLFEIFKINNTLRYLPFFQIGYLISNHNKLQQIVFKYYLISVVAHTILFILNAIYPNPLINLILSFLGITSLFGIAHKIDQTSSSFTNKRLFNWILRNNLEVYLYHQQIIMFILMSTFVRNLNPLITVAILTISGFVGTYLIISITHFFKVSKVRG